MKNLYTKIAKYHKKCVKLEKDKQNPYFKSMYMSLDNIVNTITPVLNEIGLFISHSVVEGNVETSIIDSESGELITSKFPIHGTDPQKVGSEISYGKRYNISALLNIVDSDDDDGNSATDDIKNTPISRDVPQIHTKYPKSASDDIIEQMNICEDIEQIKVLSQVLLTHAKSPAQTKFFEGTIKKQKERVQKLNVHTA